MSEILAVLDRVQTLITETEDNRRPTGCSGKVA